MDEDFVFEGFDKPSENWSKLPHVFMNFLPQITSLSELKVVLYILRHTWGYQEFDNPRHITVDEFMHGRKTKDGGRIDEGTGMSEPSIRDGLKRAENHGFITVDVNDNDKARIEKSYQLNMNQGERSLPPEGKKFTPREKKVLPRSEKETSKETSKDILSSDADTMNGSNGKKTIPAERMNPMKDAIAAAFRYDWKTMSKPEIGLVQRTARELCLIDVTPDQIPALYAYCKAQFKSFKAGALSGNVSEWRKTLQQPAAEQSFDMSKWNTGDTFTWLEGEEV